jgi:RNA polymerase sigma-70 factor (ECF subfamily)
MSMAIFPLHFSGLGSSAPVDAETVRDLDGERDLLYRLWARKERAYEILVRRYSGRMLATARRFLGAGEDSADVVQEAFCSAFQAMDGFQGKSTLSTWLHRIVVNACLMRLRSRSRQRTVSIDVLLPVFDDKGHHIQAIASWGEPWERMMRTETQDQVRSCIDLLPDDHRVVLLLRDIEGLDTAEAAKALGISIPAVKTRLHRARQALRSLLEPIFAGTAAE